MGQRVASLILAASLFALAACGGTTATSKSTPSASATRDAAAQTPVSAGVKSPSSPTPCPPTSQFPVPQGSGAPLAYAAPDKTLWSTNADGSDNRQLVCEPIGAYNAAWSSSGRFIAYVRSDGSLRILDVKTGEDVVVDDGTAGSVVSLPSQLHWSPTEDVLAYAKFGSAPGTAIGLWEVSPGTRPVALVPIAGVGDFFWSPSGRQIAYGLPSNSPTPTPSKITSYSPGQIFVVNADGSDPHKLADGSFVLYSSSPWSPDGRLLAYWKNVRGGSALTGDTYVIDVESAQEISLGAFNSDEHVGWAPARDRYVFYNLMIQPQAGTVTALFDPNGSLIDWSPDGQKVAYVQYAPTSPTLRSSTRQHSLVVLDVESGSKTTYETSTADLWVHEPGYRGDWSPDSRYYAFIGFIGGESPPGVVLYVADTRSGTTNRTSDRPGLVWYSPDGSRLLIQQGSSTPAASIWIANADGTSASKLADGTALFWGWGLPRTPWRPARN